MPVVFSAETSSGQSPRRRSLSSGPGSEKSGLVENPHLSPFKVSVSEAPTAVSVGIIDRRSDQGGVTAADGEGSAGPDVGATVQTREIWLVRVSARV